LYIVRENNHNKSQLNILFNYNKMHQF
jgi:hypothetical protein